VTVSIILEHPYDNCKNPNGQLRAEVNGGVPPVGNYTYVWYEGNDIFTSPQIGVSHVASQLEPLTYTVLVTDKATGCQSIESFTVPDQSVVPVATVITTDILCSNANSGGLSVSVGGVTVGYKFDWYNGAAVKPTPDFTGSSFTNRPAGTYTVVATDNSSDCESVPVTVTLIQTSPPVVSASTIANQTSCDPTQPNGSVAANVGGLTTGFDFEWFSGQNTLPANLVGNTPALTGLTQGIYTVRATDQVTGCSDTEEVTVANSVVMPSILVGAIASSTSCTSPNGSVTVNVTLDTPADYTFFWYDGPAVKATPDYADSDNFLDGLPPGEYTVMAIHNTKFCQTLPVTATVLDAAPPISIQVNASVTQPATDCNSNDGTMQVDLNAAGNASGFNIEWFAGGQPVSGAPFFSQSGVFSSIASGIASGSYTVVVTNLDNGCQRDSTLNLPFINAHRIQLLGQTDISQCAPTNTGEIEVRLIKSKDSLAFVFTESDYVIHVYQGQQDLGFNFGDAPSGQFIQTISGVNGVTDYFTNNNLTPGFYSLVSVSGNAATFDCRSNLLVVEIQQVVSDPVIAVTSMTSNMNCSTTNGSGQIELAIDGGANPANYNFEWFEGPDTASPPLGTATSGVEVGNGEIAANLPAGTYTVRVTDVVPDNAACFSVATVIILDNPPIMSLAAADLTVVDMTECGLPPNSSATVNTVTENGVQIPVNFGVNYNIEWFDASMTPLAGTNTIAGLAPGIYFVRATSLTTNCVTALRQFEILDLTMNSIAVTLDNFIDPTRCLKPANVLGELQVMAVGTSGTGYTYNWYAGPTASGPVISNSPTLSGIVVPIGQPDVTFTIEAINNDNNCSAIDTYVLPVVTSPITWTTSTAPLTFCTTDNGSAFATVTSGNSNDYSYNWYIGQGVKAVPDFVGQQFDNLAAGDYTVVAVDNMDNTCQTQPDTVTVLDERIPPVLATVIMNPLTHCDPTIPNGAASASANGEIVGYNFSWFQGTPPAGVPFFIGSEINTLEAMTYSIIGEDIVTGCSDTTSVVINFVPDVVPTVTPEVLSHVTSCVEGNGSVTASVEGNTQDYIFNWYNGSLVTATPDFVGELYDSLNVGFYTVTATSRLTGCTSLPATVEVISAPEFPDFDFGIQSASCDEENGYVSLFLLNSVEIETIEWDNNGVITTGPNLENVPAGTYTVTVTSFLGCTTSKEVEIKTDIHPFNGISRNNDGRNELFYIDCIDNFPDNVVRIFNRAGTLVYEAHGYDNIDIFFDGRSNRGISVMGTNLPDGTYFYVIDKQDGSKPLAGYLEIVN
jgi:uncharacterized protein YcfL